MADLFCGRLGILTLTYTPDFKPGDPPPTGYCDWQARTLRLASAPGEIRGRFRLPPAHPIEPLQQATPRPIIRVMPAPTASAGPSRTTCSIVDWPCFAEGHHKGKTYTRDDIGQMATAFGQLSTGDEPHLVPTLGLGHDREQEFATSLGFPNVGRVVSARQDPNDPRIFRVTARGIPVEVGGQVNGGFINSGSIEIDDGAPDPDNPAKTIKGPILTGIALLGGEQPAVKGLEPPRAVFDDGTEVPAASVPAKWLEKMMELRAKATPKVPGIKPPKLSKQYSAAYMAKRASFSHHSIAFSEMFQMDRAQMLDMLRQKGLPDSDLSGMTDDQLKELVDAAQKTDGQPGAMFSACKKVFAAAAPANGDGNAPLTQPKPGAAMSDPPPAAPPANGAQPAYMSQFADIEKDEKTSPTMKAFAKACFAAFSDMGKRIGMSEKAVQEVEKKGEEKEKAAFSAKVTAAVDHRIDNGSLMPNERADKITAGLAKWGSKRAFSAGHPYAGLTEGEAWIQDQYKAKPGLLFEDPDAKKATIDTNTSGKPEEDPFVQKAMQHFPGMRTPAYATAGTK